MNYFESAVTIVVAVILVVLSLLFFICFVGSQKMLKDLQKQLQARELLLSLTNATLHEAVDRSAMRAAFINDHNLNDAYQAYAANAQAGNIIENDTPTRGDDE